MSAKGDEMNKDNIRYDSRGNFRGNVLCMHASFGLDGRAYIYWFENHGFNDYNIYMRSLDIH